LGIAGKEICRGQQTGHTVRGMRIRLWRQMMTIIGAILGFAVLVLLFSSRIWLV
jgi:hypothetical protein